MLRSLNHEASGHAEDSREVVLVGLQHIDEALHGAVNIGFNFCREESVVLQHLSSSLIPTRQRSDEREKRSSTHLAMGLSS